MDLVGLTTNRVLSIFAARPSPVQITAIGYPNTTGLPAMGYRIVDEFTDPPGAEAFATEQLLRIPKCFLCYQPLPGAPEPVTEPPSAQTGTITFGSFNTAQKLVGPVIEVWSRIVNSVPGSRLVLKASQFLCPEVRARFTNRFAAAGLTTDRFELLPVVKDKSSHLAMYGRIDIALDTFPYNGTTTTCEALYMGVPVVGHNGSVHAGRVGVSLLSAVGIPELIARDTSEYESIAATLARDKDRLAEYQRTLRTRILGSPLCDGPGYGIRFGQALRAAWRAHCTGR
jgi:predicted O-linked N-acetylglucosamine transferase (SPINDLY family)